MQICKKTTLLALVSFCASFAVPETKGRITAPQMPKTHIITSPEMPKITAPSLGNGFYVPGQIRSKNQIINENKKNMVESLGASVNGRNTNPVLQQDTLKSISASDFQTLDNLGLLNGILGNSLSNSTGSSTSLLSNLLQKVNNLKTETNLENVKNKAVENPLAPVREPKILRFNINGKNVLSSFKSVFFSKPEKDGSFLFTADRKYEENNKIFNETFYLLFKKNNNNMIGFEYIVEPSLIQATKNEKSLLFKLTNQKNLIAKKTGNLFYIKHTTENYNMDLLIDLGTLS